MKRCFNSIISVFCCLAIVVSFSIVPVYAEGGILDSAVGVAKDFVEWSVKFQQDSVNGFWRYIFGDDFNTATNEELKAAYDDYVQTLPAQGYDSSGGLLWSPEHDYTCVNWRITPTQFYYCSHYPGESSSVSPEFTSNFDCPSNSVRIVPVSGGSSFSGINVQFFYKGTVPVEGFYTLLPSPAINGYCSYNGSNTSLDKNWNGFSSPVFYALGDSVSLNIFTGRKITDGISGTFLLAQGIAPVYKVTPAASFSADTYNTNTRPGSLVGLYGDVNGEALPLHSTMKK